MDGKPYKSLGKLAEGLYKVKGSKHLGFAMPVANENEIQNRLAELRKAHPLANHHAYAWRLRADHGQFRANDDGEPSNSAGKPILGQIEKYDLTDVLVVVVRYFGGTKLGVGGLIDAYRTAAAAAIEANEIIEIQPMLHIRLDFTYAEMQDVMLAIRTHTWSEYDHSFADKCSLKLKLHPSQHFEIEQVFTALKGVHLTILGVY